MHSQSTCKKLLFCSSWFAVCSSAGRQLVWGLVMGFSIVFKRQRTTHTLTSRDTAAISHRKSHSKGHRQRSDTWLPGLPLHRHYQAVAQPLGRWLSEGQWREHCQSEGSSLTAYFTKGNDRVRGGDLLRVTWTVNPGPFPFPPPFPWKASFLLPRSPRTWESEAEPLCPSGLLCCWTNSKSRSLSGSQFSHLWSGGMEPDDFQ